MVDLFYSYTWLNTKHVFFSLFNQCPKLFHRRSQRLLSNKFFWANQSKNWSLFVIKVLDQVFLNKSWLTRYRDTSNKVFHASLNLCTTSPPHPPTFVCCWHCKSPSDDQQSFWSYNSTSLCFHIHIKLRDCFDVTVKNQTNFASIAISKGV